MRREIVVGNWKMNKTTSEAVTVINELKPLVECEERDVVFCVPFVSLTTAVDLVKDTNVKIGAQNLYFEEAGAYTGEISAEMLADVGVQYVIIGHSERREKFGETDENVNKKVIKAIERGLTPIICCGETLKQREQGVTIDFIRQQIKISFLDVLPEDAKNAIVAYEPIWAIGTGRVATAEQAQEICAAIRQCLKEIYGAETANEIRILYGGSVTGVSAPKLFARPDIDGVLVGGASLKPDFGRIVNYNKQ